MGKIAYYTYLIVMYNILDRCSGWIMREVDWYSRLVCACDRERRWPKLVVLLASKWGEGQTN